MNTYPRYTSQTAFDAALAHLRKQGCRSFLHYHDAHGDEMAGCRYRGPNGTMCAIGALIPDEALATINKYLKADIAKGAESSYRLKSCEGMSAGALKDLMLRVDTDTYGPPVSGIFAGVNPGLLTDIQRYMHDEIPDLHFGENLEEAAERVALTYNLTYTAPETTA